MNAETVGTAVTGPPGRPKAPDERLSPVGRMTRALQRPELGSLLGAVVVFGLFAATDSTAQHLWLTLTGVAAWSQQAAFFGIMAVPVGLLMIGGEFDLSAGVMTGVGAIVMGLLAGRLHWNAWLAIAGTLAFAALITTRTTPYPVGDRFVLLKRGRLMASYLKRETTVEGLTQMMAGGAELQELSRELQGLAVGDAEVAEVAREVAREADARQPGDTLPS